MEKKNNTKENIEFLKKIKTFVVIVGLSVGIFACAKCSHDELVKNKKTIDHTGIIVDNPDCEENVKVLKKIK